MQSSLWKLLTAVGIIGIGTLVVLEVQSRLPNPSKASSDQAVNPAASITDADTDIIPDATTELDRMLSGDTEIDDSQFALNEPTADRQVAESKGTADSQDFAGDTSVDQTVLKGSLTEGDNSFERAFESQGTSESAKKDTATESKSMPAATIQPASFDGDSVPADIAAESSAKKKKSTSATLFFGANDSRNSTVVEDSGNDNSPLKSSPVEDKKQKAVTSDAADSDNRTAAAGAVIPTAQNESETPDLFMPDTEPAFDKLENPELPTEMPEVDVPLMEVPGFNGDPEPKSEFKDEPAEPRLPDRNEAPVDSNPGNPSPSPGVDDKTRYFEPDEPATTSPGRNGGSIPETRPAPPTNFELDPVPERDAPRESPESDPRPRSAPQNPIDDEFPAPSYPEKNPRSGLDADAPFDTSPARDSEIENSRDLPVISDRPRSSTPDRTRGDLRDSEGESTDRSMSQVMRPQLSIEKDAPDQATVGVPHEYTIVVSNDGASPAFDIVVDDDLGDTAKLEYSRPPAEFDRDTGKLSWKIPELAPRKKQEILVRITPTGEGTLDGIATVRFKAQVKSTTVITAPKIALEVTGPAEVKVGDEVQLRYIVRNDGTGDATNVILRSVLPPGLKHLEGGDLEYEIDILRAGDQEKIDLTVSAVEPGSLRTNSVVTMSGVSADSATTQIDIVGSQLTIQRLGPDRRYVGRTAKFQNIVRNESNFEANNAIVTEQVPEGMRFVSADNGGVYNPMTGEIRWDLDRLLPHKQAVLEVELEAESAGQRQTIVEVLESAGFRSRATENTVVTVEDYENMTADISRQDAPVAVGETFGFTITIENRGTAVARNVEMVVNVPSEISVKAAGTRMNPARRVGNAVHYALVEEIQPAEKMSFELKLQGERPARNALVRASLKYEHLQEPLIVTESVTIFE